MFIFDDAGRTQSKRSRQKNDCTVRALAVVTAKPYDGIYDLLAEAGRKCSRGFNFVDWLGKTGSIFGYRYQWKAFQAVKGQRRMNPYSFLTLHPHGRFILRTAKHVFAVVNGVIRDTHKPLQDRCVYGCWEFVKE
jgi:hypothetical protein